MYKYLYIDANTFVHRLDPRVKMLVVLAHYILLAIWIEQIYLMLALLLETLLLAVVSKSLPNLKRVFLVIVIVFFSGELSWLLIGHGTTPLIGPITVEPVLQGLSTVIRAVAGIIVSIILLSTTRNEEIALGLIKIGLPFKAGFAFSSALRMAPLLIAMTTAVAAAQKSRGLDLDHGGPVQRLKRHVPLFAPAFLSTMRSVDQLAMAIEARGFGCQKQRGSLIQLGLGLIDYIFITASLLLIIVGIAVAISGWGAVYRL